MFQGGRLDLPTYINMEISKLRVAMFLSTTIVESFISSRTSQKTTCFDPSKQVYDDDINMETQKYDPQRQGGNVVSDTGMLGVLGPMPYHSIRRGIYPPFD